MHRILSDLPEFCWRYYEKHFSLFFGHNVCIKHIHTKAWSYRHSYLIPQLMSLEEEAHEPSPDIGRNTGHTLIWNWTTHCAMMMTMTTMTNWWLLCEWSRSANSVDYCCSAWRHTRLSSVFCPAVSQRIGVVVDVPYVSLRPPRPIGPSGTVSHVHGAGIDARTPIPAECWRDGPVSRSRDTTNDREIRRNCRGVMLTASRSVYQPVPRAPC